jgi:hypothetical protein
MISATEQKPCVRLRAPRENRSLVLDPPWNDLSDLIRRNVSLQSQPDYDLQGPKLSEIRRQARRELLAAARQWTATYSDLGPPPGDPTELIFLAGHQPQMFHPGVWLKNFALSRLAKQHRATAVNLIIDSDAVAATALRVPGGIPQNPSAALLPFDRPEPAIPYEERRIEDRALFDPFGQRVCEQTAGLIDRPLMEKYWSLVIAQSRQSDRLGASLAGARHIIEAQWGSTTLEIPQSWVCDLDCFHWLTAHLLAQLPRFSAVYNETVREYRRRYRIRSASHPVPDLAVDDEWIEAPFWIWSRENPRRKRLFAKRACSEIIISDRENVNERLSLSEEGEIRKAGSQIAELARRGVKIRSRALVTTLWARLVLGDLFIHGIGGGNYDCLTDRIIERFFNRQPPGFMILSATLHLPVHQSPLPTNLRSVPEEGQGEGSNMSPLPTNLRSVPEEGQGEGSMMGKDPAAIDRQLRELTYHPERYINGVFHQSTAMPGEVQDFVNSKRQWISTPQTSENAKIRCRAIRNINESLQPYLEGLRAQLLDRRVHAAERLRAKEILTWREYGFCLYPEQTLCDFFDALLPH